MNFQTVMDIVAGLLQFFVAGYALRLNRVFGTARVGWSLFWAFALLALLHLVQSITSFNFGEPLGVKINVMYSLISLLLLVGMVHLETLLKERVRVEQEEQRMRNELELQVQKKTAYLTRAIEELQAEMDERKRMEAQLKQTSKELLEASLKTEMANMADCLQHSADNMLKKVNLCASLAADPTKRSKIADLVRMGNRTRDHGPDVDQKQDPQEQEWPLGISQLAELLTDEQTILANELDSLRQSVNDIRAIQQNCLKLAGKTNLAGIVVNVENEAHGNVSELPQRAVLVLNKSDRRN